MTNANISGSKEKRYSEIFTEVPVPMLSTRNVGKRVANMKNASSSGKNGMFIKYRVFKLRGFSGFCGLYNGFVMQNY
ncbi:MAG TPA: hypothetical protein PLZ67_01010 [Bacteroidales bacterium]|nr:hypothetical protein [Bacteroidales bacterium]HPF01016.1 hypothetical protein [Bacteroidales bacterium]